jgi:hypothetical protein
MSIKQHHLEWLKLLDVSGPFLSPKVLSSTFPQGLDEIDPSIYRKLKLEVEDFEINPTNEQARYLSTFVLNEILGFSYEVLKSEPDVLENFSADFPEHSENVTPDFIVYNPDYEALENPGEARIFFKLYDPSISLDKSSKDSLWKASPAAKVTDAIRTLSLELAIITNGDHWMLIYAPKGQNTTYASWYSNIWFEEKVTIRSFKTLLSFHRLFGVTPEESLEGLFISSLADQEELTDKLGKQVLRSVELLVSAIDKIDKDSGRELLKGFDEKKLYEASVTVMMRLIFMLAAEERDLFFLGESFYDENYAISTLVDKLQEDSDRLGEDVIERRSDAWTRILATFRAVYGGVNHQAMRLPAYGGGLFDPDRFPFLEGRISESSWEKDPAKPLPINNVEVLYLLKSIQYLEAGTSEARRLSFRALDVEQIGYIYEGLLDHTAKRAKEVTVSLVGSKDSEPEVALSLLETWINKSEQKFVEELKKITKRTENSIKKALAYNPTDDDKRLLAHSCENDQQLVDRCFMFYSFIRKDSFGYPVVIHPGSVFVTEGEDRRSSGTHYTPKILTEPVVQYTLEPLVYNGPKEGKEKKDWTLKTPEEILDLKVCDIACGSAAFLVQACRYLSERLVESWAEREKFFSDQIITYPYGLPQKDGVLQQGIIEKDEEKRLLDARRYIVSRCLYGVDKNPLAVEMAKLSMWLITMEKGKPFSFLDNSFKSGNSLFGFLTMDEVLTEAWLCEETPSLDSLSKYKNKISALTKLRIDLEMTPGFVLSDIQKKKSILKFITSELYDVVVALDSILLQSCFEKDVSARCEDGSVKDFSYYKGLIGKPFHWAVEFPEIFIPAKQGFDAIVGNPPFLGNVSWSSKLGSFFQKKMEALYNVQIGKSDLCSLFFRRSFSLLNLNGTAGIIGTDTLTYGDSRKVSLKFISENGYIYRSFSPKKWPAGAQVFYLIAFFTRSKCNLIKYLDNEPSDIISSRLRPVPDVELKVPSGGIVAAKGVDITKCEHLIIDEGVDDFLELEKCKYFRRLITSEDLNTHFFANIKRVVFYSTDSSLVEISKDETAIKFLEKNVKPFRDEKYLKGYEQLLSKWWHLWRPRAEFFQEIRSDDYAIVVPVVSKYFLCAKVDTSWISTDKIIVCKKSRADILTVLCSSIAAIWIEFFSGSRGEGMSIALNEAVKTFPLPIKIDPTIEKLGLDFLAEMEAYAISKKAGFTYLINGIRENKREFGALRDKLVKIDNEIIALYGWEGISLDHNFYDRGSVVTWGLSEHTKRRILLNLIKLNSGEV